MTRASLEDLHRKLPTLAISHRAALLTAAKCIPSPQIRNAHSTGVTAYLSEYFRRAVPNPDYVTSAELSPLAEFDEESNGTHYFEGGRTSVWVNRFERDSRAREKCISHHGLNCSVCGMSICGSYGPLMKSFIHVHHVVPLSDMGENYKINPVTDLRPVCPNCHAVIHRQRPPMSIADARNLLAR